MYWLEQTAVPLGFLAAACIAAGLVLTIMKRHVLGLLSGCADMLLVILSAQGLRYMMMSSGKVLTQELFGFGNNKPVLTTYALMFAFGAAYALIGAIGLVKNRRIKTRNTSVAQA